MGFFWRKNFFEGRRSGRGIRKTNNPVGGGEARRKKEEFCFDPIGFKKRGDVEMGWGKPDGKKSGPRGAHAPGEDGLPDTPLFEPR